MPPKLRVPYQTIKPDDTLRIAFIGDSWGIKHSTHQKCLIAEKVEKKIKIPTKIYSDGLSGKTSKEIYQSFFDEKGLKKFLLGRSYNFCIISAGINDVNTKMSKKYYIESMNAIIHFLLSNHICPIIIEIPEFDDIKYYQSLNLLQKAKCRISMLINNIPLDCKHIYREALNEFINEKGYGSSVKIVHYQSRNNHFLKDQDKLYTQDGIHLNEYGFNILDSIIVEEIIDSAP